MSILDVFNDRQKALMEKAMPHRNLYKDTEFFCNCDGTVYPTSETHGECFACGEEHELAGLHYEGVGESGEDG